MSECVGGNVPSQQHQLMHHVLMFIEKLIFLFLGLYSFLITQETYLNSGNFLLCSRLEFMTCIPCECEVYLCEVYLTCVPCPPDAV